MRIEYFDHTVFNLSFFVCSSWSEKPKEWKFQKTRQTWLLLHMYEKEKVCINAAFAQNNYDMNFYTLVVAILY